MPAPPPITPEQMQELTRADERERGFIGARKLALWNGTGFAICAGLTLPFAWGEPTVALSALVLAAFAWIELQGRKGLLAFDPRAAQRLCLNEVAVCVVIVLYAALQIRAGLSEENPMARVQAGLAAQLDGSSEAIDDMMAQAGPMYRKGVVIFYALLALVAVVFQGGSALYYARCRKRMAAFVSETPAWVIEYKRMSPR